jgi:hypothetical protein
MCQSILLKQPILVDAFLKSFDLIGQKCRYNGDYEKPWMYKGKNVKGWWCGWYESGKRKAKALPRKALAEHYRHIKYTQLNSDVFTGTVAVDWAQKREEYMHYKKVKGDEQTTLYETALTLRHFEVSVRSSASFFSC